MNKEVFSQETRRKVLTRTLRTAFPYESMNKESKMNKVDEFLRAENGLVFVINHFSLRDFFTILEKLVLESKEIPSKKFVIPIAEHQNNNYVLSKLANWGNVELCSLFTRETKVKEDEMKKLGKKIPWEIQDVGYGNIQYLKTASSVLSEGGCVMVAPQGTRKSTIEPFENNSISALLAFNKRNRGKPLGFVFVGLGNLDSDDYSKSGFNIRDRYGINMSDPISGDNLILEAKNKNHSPEMEAYNRMLEVVPRSYK